MNTSRLSAGVLAMLVLSGCATIITGTSQGITLESDPSGAACSITRDGQKLASVNSTPTQVMLSKGWSDLSVDCTREGSAPSKTAIPSTFQPWALANILLGGIIGFIVDGASGAITEYPTIVETFLAPSEFASEKERDAFFDQKRAAIEDEAAKASTEVRDRFQISKGMGQSIDSNCTTSACVAALKPIEERRTRRLAALESQRSAVRVKVSGVQPAN